MARIQVIGGGFSGLSAAFFLARAGHEVRVVESARRAGGMLQTLPTPYGPAETAANAILASALVEEVAGELGLELTAALPSARRRFVLREGRARRWPLGLKATLGFATRTLPRFWWQKQSLAPRAGESVADWGERALGSEATRQLLVPGLSGVYAGEARELSASLIFSRWFSGEPRSPRGRLRGSVAPPEGMGAWAPAFRAFLEHKGAGFTSIPEPDLPTVVALPPPAAAAFLRDRAPALAAAAAQVKMLPVVSVTAFFPENAPGLEGFGCLFPREEGYRVLGRLANDRIFPGRAKGARSETWIFGGATDAGILALDDEQLRELISGERARLHGSPAPLLHAQITRWERAIPHYDLTLERVLGPLRTTGFREGHFRLFGNWLGQLGLGRILEAASQLPQEFS